MIQKLFEKLGRRRVITDRDSKKPYLIRYYLFLKDRKNFPFNITLHKVLVSDEPVLHDSLAEKRQQGNASGSHYGLVAQVDRARLRWAVPPRLLVFARRGGVPQIGPSGRRPIQTRRLH